MGDQPSARSDAIGFAILAGFVAVLVGLGVWLIPKLGADPAPPVTTSLLAPITTSVPTTTLVPVAEAESFCWGWANGIWVGQGMINEMTDPEVPAAPPPQVAWDETYAACLGSKELRAAVKPQAADLELRSEVGGRTHPALVCTGYVTGLRDVHRSAGLEQQYGPLPPADLTEVYDACMAFNYWERPAYTIEAQAPVGGGPPPRLR